MHTSATFASTEAGVTRATAIAKTRTNNNSQATFCHTCATPLGSLRDHLLTNVTTTVNSNDNDNDNTTSSPSPSLLPLLKQLLTVFIMEW